MAYKSFKVSLKYGYNYKVEYSEEGGIDCVTQAVMSQREISIEWRGLKDKTLWRQGWF